jgi:hypothetical protein
LVLLIEEDRHDFVRAPDKRMMLADENRRKENSLKHDLI